MDYSLWPTSGTGALPGPYSPTFWATNNDWFGNSASFIGDFNGDGYDDIAIGAPYGAWDGKKNGSGPPTLPNELMIDVGYVAIFFGSPEGLGLEYPAAPSGAAPDPDIFAGYRFLKIYPPQPEAQEYFGSSVAGGADIDGSWRVKRADGVMVGGSDMVVGAPGFTYSSPYANNDWAATGVGGGASADLTAGLFFPPDGGWFRNVINEGVGTDTNYGGAAGANDFNIPTGGAATGTAYVFYGRSFQGAAPSALVENPSRATFWSCGARNMDSGDPNQRQSHFSCLVRSNAEANAGMPGYSILFPRTTSASFGSSVAVAGIPSYYDDTNSPWPLTGGESIPRKFRDPNRDGFAEVFVGASGGGGTGEIWEYYGNRGRIFGGNPWNGMGTQARFNDPECPGWQNWAAGMVWTDPALTATQKQNCVPVRILPNSVSAGAGMASTRGGMTVADVTGDGILDLVVGAPYDSTQGTNAGAVYAFTSSPTNLFNNVPGVGLSTNFKKMLSTTGNANDQLGYSVAAGNFDRDLDVNGRALVDVAAGAPFDDRARPAGGVGHLFLTGGNTLPSVKFDSDVKVVDSLATPQSYGYFSSRVVGDINGDGYDDAVARMKRFDSAGNVVYDAVVFFGSPEGLVTSTFCRNHIDKVFTDGMSSINDCFPMLMHSNPNLKDAMTPPQKIAKPNSEGNGWAAYFDGVGDVNGDGFDDVLFWDGTSSIVLYYGAANGLQAVTNPSWVPAVGDPQIVSRVLTPTFYDFLFSQGNINNGWDSWPFAHGDFNGDGYSDVVIGNPQEYRSPGGQWPCNDGTTPGAFDPQGYCSTGYPVTYHGGVYVLYGSDTGIQTPSVRAATQASDFVIPSNVNYTYPQDTVVYPINDPNRFPPVPATAGQLIFAYGLEDETGAGGETPCTGPDDGKLCLNSYIPNPAYERLEYGYAKMNSHGFGAAVAVVNEGGPNNPYDSLYVAAPGYEDLDCWSDKMPVSPPTGTNGRYTNYGRVYVYHGKPQGLRGGLRQYYYPYRNAPHPGSVPPWPSNSAPPSGQSPVAQFGGHPEDTPYTIDCGGVGVGQPYVIDPSLRTEHSQPNPIGTPGPLRALSPPVPEVTTGLNITNRFFGVRMTPAGDVNKDGYEDLLVVGPNESVPGIGTVGTAYLFYGPICGWDNELQTTTEAEKQLNRQIRNGSGIPSLQQSYDNVEAPQVNAELACTQQATSGQRKPPPQKFYVRDGIAGARYGVTTIGGRIGKGDVNGDGYDDVVLGTPFYTDAITGRTNVGRGVVFFGSAQGINAEDFPNVTVVKGANNKYNPFSMIPGYAGNGNYFFYYNLSIGDVNQDGTADIMVVSSTSDGEDPIKGVDLGAFFLFY
jgi:hypothetical protein